MLRFLSLILAMSALAACQQTQPPAKAPETPVHAVRQVFTPPPPFSENADPKDAIRKALEAAAADSIRVLIVWGADDDKGSAQFLAARGAPAIAQPRFFSDEYRTVYLNVGRLDKNIELAKGYGAKLTAEALPALTVLDADGKVIADTNATALRPDADLHGIDPVKLGAFLKSHQAPAPDAVAPFEAALKQAKSQGKIVLVWFSAPW
jgi:hypothetical protein